MKTLAPLLFKIKFLFWKIASNLILSTSGQLSGYERFIKYLKSVSILSPFAFILDSLHLWFSDNRLFVTGGILFVGINMGLGWYVHYKKNDLNWERFFEKTFTMIFVLIIVYLIIEILISLAGDNTITNAFRITFQISTLLYPGSKILKNAFIYSKGEFPPEWLMKKLYNFNKDGNLSEFLDFKNKKDKYEDEE